MSARELIEHVFAGEKPPRIPVYGVITSDVLMEYFGGETLTLGIPRKSPFASGLK